MRLLASLIILAVGASVLASASASVSSRSESPSSGSASSSASAPPGVPQDFVLKPGPGSVTALWKTPASDGGSSINGYKIMRGIMQGGAKTVIASVAALADPRYEDKDVRVGTKYYYQISAFNDDGEGPRTGELGAEPLPASGYPDLHVRWIEVLPTEPSPGSRVVVRVLVDNVGRDPAPSALVRVQMDGALMIERYTPVLYPKGDTLVESSAIVGPGAHTISAYVDPDNKLPESDEVNNYLLKTFVVAQGSISEPGDLPWAGFVVAVVAGSGIAYVAYVFTRKSAGKPPAVVRAATPPARVKRR